MNATRTDPWMRWLALAFAGTIVVFYLGDIGRRLGFLFEWEFVRFTAVAKGVVLLMYTLTFMAFAPRYWRSRTGRQMLLAVLSLLTLFLVGQTTGSFAVNGLEGIRNNLVYLSRFMYLPVSFLLFYPLLEKGDIMSKLMRLFELFFFFNVAMMLLGLVFGIDIFRTYYPYARLGFMGFYNSNNQASYYFILMMMYYYYRTFYQGARPYKLILTVLVSLLIGTKKIYFVLPLLVFYDFVAFRRYANRYYLTGLAVLAVTGAFFWQPISQLVRDKFWVFFDVWKEQGLLTALASMRNLHLEITFNELVQAKWHWHNYLIGGAEFYNTRSEMEFFDIFFFFGLAGVIIYVWLFIRIMRFFGNDRFLWAMLAILLLLTGLASGFIISANQPIVFLLVFAVIAHEQRRSKIPLKQ
mgnify:CR=1 FL=1